VVTEDLKKGFSFWWWFARCKTGDNDFDSRGVSRNNRWAFHAGNKEQLGGYYLFECENLISALKYATMIPTAKAYV
jgi:hypothetical protein